MIPVNTLESVESKQTFFVVVPPGFESLAYQELVLKGAIGPGFAPECRRFFKGGIELDLPSQQGFELINVSRIATRVLVRLEKFRCRDFPKLYKKTRGVSWAHWFSDCEGLEISVSARQSRLMNKKRISETVLKGVRDSKSWAEPSKKTSPYNLKHLFVRFENDEVEFSLSLANEDLFKRGYKVLEAKAPLRENLAAGLFYSLYLAAGEPKKWSLLDLMCGSGTLLTEAALFFSNQKILEKSVHRLYGFDQESTAVELAQKNLSAIEMSSCGHIQKFNFLKDHPSPTLQLAADEILIGLSNPPYGVRIKWPAPPKIFYAKMMAQYEEMGCSIYGFIVPRAQKHLLPEPSMALPFKNGGLDVIFHIYRTSKALYSDNNKDL